MTFDFNKSDEELNQELKEADEEWRKDRKRVKIVLLSIFLFSGLFICGLAGFLLYGAHQDNLSRERMENERKEVMADLNDLHQIIYQGGRTEYRASYEFNINGNSYYGTSDLTWNPSRKELVIYDPQNPNMNRLKGGKREDDSLFSSEFLARTLYIVVIGFALSGFGALKSRWKKAVAAR